MVFNNDSTFYWDLSGVKYWVKYSTKRQKNQN